MSFETKEIKKIAHLARLAISNDQANSLVNDFNNIIGFVEKMKQSDTENVKPLSHPYDISQPVRDDQVTEKNERQSLQSIAPDTKAGLYIVPQFIETE